MYFCLNYIRVRTTIMVFFKHHLNKHDIIKLLRINGITHLNPVTIWIIFILS